MRVAIFVTNPKDSYSGGRYHSLVLAECLAYKGHEVYYITNNKPIFYKDFDLYETHYNIKLIITHSFNIEIPGDHKFDFVVLVPHQNPDSKFYDAVKKFARWTEANLVLINFESPNWFNKFSPVKRDEKKWEQWLNCCEEGCLVLSSAKESQSYAKNYYTTYPDRTYFDYWYPAINSRAADKGKAEKEKRIVVITRLEDKHKGSDDVLDVIDSDFAGYTLVFLLGRGAVDRQYKERLEHIKKKFNVNYEIKYKLSDVDKFKEIKRAQLMLFPSYFEGFGYPPIEAQYCGTLCVVYDLPVLRETSKEGVIYARWGDKVDFQLKAKEALKFNYDSQKLRSGVFDIANFEARAEKLEKTLCKYTNIKFFKKPRSQKVLPSKISLFTKLKNKIFGNRNRIRISQIEVRGSRLKVKGWVYSTLYIDEVRVFVNCDKEINVEYGIKRPDVVRNYPEVKNINCGFVIDDFVAEEERVETPHFYLFSKGKLIDKKLVPIKKK